MGKINEINIYYEFLLLMKNEVVNYLKSDSDSYIKNLINDSKLDIDISKGYPDLWNSLKNEFSDANKIFKLLGFDKKMPITDRIFLLLAINSCKEKLKLENISDFKFAKKLSQYLFGESLSKEDYGNRIRKTSKTIKNKSLDEYVQRLDNYLVKNSNFYLDILIKDPRYKLLEIMYLSDVHLEDIYPEKDVHNEGVEITIEDLKNFNRKNIVREKNTYLYNVDVDRRQTKKYQFLMTIANQMYLIGEIPDNIADICEQAYEHYLTNGTLDNIGNKFVSRLGVLNNIAVDEKTYNNTINKLHLDDNTKNNLLKLFAGNRWPKGKSEAVKRNDIFKKIAENIASRKKIIKHINFFEKKNFSDRGTRDFLMHVLNITNSREHDVIKDSLLFLGYNNKDLDKIAGYLSEQNSRLYSAEEDRNKGLYDDNQIFNILINLGNLKNNMLESDILSDQINHVKFLNKILEKNYWGELLSLTPDECNLIGVDRALNDLPFNLRIDYDFKEDIIVMQDAILAKVIDNKIIDIIENKTFLNDTSDLDW